jgi:nucleoside-diphosphate-sugar epimerase
VVGDERESCQVSCELPETWYNVRGQVSEDHTIRDLAALIAEVVGFDGALRFDTSKPSGTPRKLLDVSRLASLGWEPKTSLRQGIRLAYQEFLNPFDPMLVHAAPEG